MHVLKTDVPDIVFDLFPDFLGHFALQNAGESLIDKLPMKRDGLGSGAQDPVDSKLSKCKGRNSANDDAVYVQLGDSTVSNRVSSNLATALGAADELPRA